jgi:hypothetical protein
VIATTKHLCIALNVALAQVLVFAAFVVWFTGNTDGLVAVGQMAALIIDAFVP